MPLPHREVRGLPKMRLNREWIQAMRGSRHDHPLGALRRFIAALFCCGLGVAQAGPGLPAMEDETPGVRALLAQAWAAETGDGLKRDPGLAATLYRQAGELGSSEGYYRAALVLLSAYNPAAPPVALCLLAVSSQLGHADAATLLERHNPDGIPEPSICSESSDLADLARFDMTAYLAGLHRDKKRVAAMIRQLAPKYSVDVKLALAIASAESNFDPNALSPRMAMGVMQLIPSTAQRFNVSDPYDAEQNIRGGLAYLRWLNRYFSGNTTHVIAAYNAGEGAVLKYDGVPPFHETINYVARVLIFAGIR